MAGGQTKFGIPAERFAGFENQGDLAGRIVPPIMEGLGNFGQAVADYDYSAAPPDYAFPNIGIASGPALNAPLAGARPEDNPIKAKGVGPGASGAEATPEQQAMTPEDRLALAKYRKAHDMALNMGDLMALDDENVRLHPGGKNASSTTSSFSRAVAPKGKAWEENQAALQKAMDTRQEIRVKQVQDTHDLAMAQNENAMQAARLGDAHAQELVGMGARQEKANADYKVQLDRTMADQEKANTAYRKAADDYDPHRLMHSGSGVLASLALALGAFGSTISHTQDNIPQMIENAINRDLDKQKTGIASKKEQVTWLDKVMAGNRARFSDENAARLMTRANAKEVLGAKYEAMATRMGGVERIAAAKDHVNEINMSRAQDVEHALRLEEAVKRDEAGRRQTQTTTSQADTIVRPGDLIRNAKAAAETEKALREASGGPKLSAADASLTNKQLASIAELGSSSQGLRDLEAQRANSNVFSRALGTGEGGKQNVAEEVAAQKYGRAISGTASSEPEHERIKGVIRGSAFTFSDEAKNRGPEQLRRNAVEEARAKFMSIPDAAKPGAAARLVGMGFEPDEVKEIVTGEAPTDYSSQIASHGGR